MYVTLSIPKPPNSDFNTAQIVTTCTVGITQHALKGRVFKIRLKFGTFFSRIIGLTN